MKPVIVLAVLIAATAPAAAQQGYCPYGQTCQSGNQVPFPVVNPAQGLSNILTMPLRNNQPPPQSETWRAPIATPPPVMPPGH